MSMDDGGLFTYHPQAADLLACFEYADEAACIIDSNGCSFRILAGPVPRLSGAHGMVEFTWLREQWLAAQKQHPRLYRVRRFHPAIMEALLADLFETLELDQDPGLLRRGTNGYAEDRYGHRYKVVPGRGHLHSRGRVGTDPVRDASGPWYVEVQRR